VFEPQIDPADVVVPDDFRSWIVSSQGLEGQAWLDDLPGILDQLCSSWNLKITGTAMHGGHGLVLPVLQGDQSCVLKVASRNEPTHYEAAALLHWDGLGMVRLFEYSEQHGGMLLEMLGPQSLETLPWQESIPILGDLIRLHSIDGPARFPETGTLAESIASSLASRWESCGKPMPSRVLDRAHELAETHTGPHSTRMVNKDLHFENVLRGDRAPWITIDPKPLVGDPECGPAQIFWRVIDRLTGPDELLLVFDLLAEHGELDRQLFRDWTLVRTVDYWLWALSVGLTEDPVRCETVIDWLGY
jgi:streptomycin 6-kinase